MTPNALGKSQATDKLICPVTMENQPQNIKHEIKGLLVSVSHNGGHGDRWNMKMYVIFVLLLRVRFKVNRLRFKVNILRY